MSTIQTLHKLTSPLLYKTGLYQKMWRQRSREAPFTFVAVYHRVVADDSSNKDNFDIERGMPASVFEKQMRFLLRHFTPVKASQTQLEFNNAMQFAVTLDDGYEDNYLVAAPILKKLGIPATFFVVSDYVGTDRLFWWEQVADMMHKTKQAELDLQAVIPSLCKPDEQTTMLSLHNRDERDYAYGQLCTRIRNGLHVDIPLHMKRISDFFGVHAREEGRNYGLMDWAQLSDLIQQGFEIGGHTATHCNVVGSSESTIKQELIDSVNVLETHLDTPIESFAYPYGLFERSSKIVTSALAETHCKAAYTIEQGVVNADTPMYEMPRAKLNRPYDFACAFNVQDTLNSSVNSG